MNALTFDARKTATAARFVLLAAAALALAACQTTDSGSPTAADAPKAEIASVKPDAAAPKPQTAKPAEPVEDLEPMTRTRAARECWMKSEKGNAHESLDKRADLVNKCIDDKMKAAGAAAPKS
jgi:hypothetical protein